MVPLVKKLVQMVKVVIPLVPMVQMLPTNGTIGRTPNTRADSNGYVRGSPNGKICKSTNGTVGTIFTNGNQKTLNVCLLPMVPLVDHMVEFLSC